MTYDSREWIAGDCAVFLAVRGAWGAFSNFHPSPLTVEGLRFSTAEALYQALRFPDCPELQTQIAEAGSPKAAKLIARSHIHQTRADWDEVKVEIMRWTIRIKAQQWPTLLHVLATSYPKPIVEYSTRDSFWGAKPTERTNVLRGQNVLGRVIMEFRDELRPGLLDEIAPPPVDRVILRGENVGTVQKPDDDLPLFSTMG